MTELREEVEDKMNRLESLITKFEGLAKPARSPVNSANFNVNAGGIVSAFLMVVMAVFCGVTVGLYVASRADAAADRLDMKEQIRADTARLQQDIKDLRDKQDVFQAYINAGYVKPAKDSKK